MGTVLDKSGNANHATTANVTAKGRKFVEIPAEGKVYHGGVEITPDSTDYNRLDVTTEGTTQAGKVLTANSDKSLSMEKGIFVDGRITWQPDKEHYFFDKTNDYITVPDDATINPTGLNFCIEMVIEPDSITGTQSLINKWDNTGDGTGFKIYMLNNSVLFTVNDGTASPLSANSLIDSGVMSPQAPDLEAGVIRHLMFHFQENLTNGILGFYNFGVGAVSGLISAGYGNLTKVLGTLSNGSDMFVGIDYDGTSTPFGGKIHLVRLWNYSDAANLESLIVGATNFTTDFLTNRANLDPVPAELSNSNFTEVLSETDFATHANWATTGDFDDTGGNAVWTWSTDQTSTLTQASGGFASALEPNKKYAFEYDSTENVAGDGTITATITTAIATEAVTVDLAPNSGRGIVYFTTNNSPGDFVISITASGSSQGTYTLDNFALHRAGVLLELTAEGIGTGVWRDTTSNANHGTATGATASNLKDRVYEQILIDPSVSGKGILFGDGDSHIKETTDDNFTWTADSVTFSGTVTGAGSVLSGANPALQFKDTNCTDADVNAQIDAQATDTGTGTEDVDVVFQQQIAGNLTTWLTADADGYITFNRGIVSGGVIIGSGNKYLLDGGDDTYLTESSADVLDTYVGGDNVLRMTENGTYNQVIINPTAVQDDAAHPSLAFYGSGSFNDGFYNAAAGDIRLTLGGVLKWYMNTNGIYQVNGVYLKLGTPSSTNPVHSFHNDSDTGVSSRGGNADILYNIAGGLPAQIMSEGNGEVSTVISGTVVETITDATSAGDATLTKAGENFDVTCSVGDVVLVYGGSTAGDYGTYIITAVTSATVLTLDRALSGSDADVDFDVIADGIVVENSTDSGNARLWIPLSGGIHFSDGDTYLHEPSADVFSIVTGGETAMTWTEAGRLTTQSYGMFCFGTGAGITASTTQAQGEQPLVNSLNEVSTVGNANDVVTLPSAVAGMEVTIVNNGANTLQIFPASGDNLGAGVDTSTTLAATENVTYQAYDATNWITKA